jgi:hypothetical protein
MRAIMSRPAFCFDCSAHHSGMTQNTLPSTILPGLCFDQLFVVWTTSINPVNQLNRTA